MKKGLKYSIALFSIAWGIQAYGQETLTNLIENPELKRISKSHSKTVYSRSKASYEIPFIDDFAKENGYPDTSKWIDNKVFINNSYPYQPVSVGVATFDVLDETGSMYPNASIVPFGADTLTSRPINLNYPGNTSIFLSFFYQPGGLGDVPETEDILYVDYYSPDSAKWYPAWHVSYTNTDSSLTEYYHYNLSTKVIKDTNIYPAKNFKNVILPVAEDQYLKSTFQFRFRNKASLANTGNTSLVAGNVDQWHIDFVKLDTARSINDSIIDDFCFIKPIGSLLKNYESLPWLHFSRANAYEMKDSITIVYANYYDTIVNPYRYYEFKDIWGESGVFSFTGGTFDDVHPGTSQSYSIKTNYIFPYSPVNDSALFQLKSYLQIKNPLIFKEYRWNDTIQYYQKFYNYYAYDDGTAEGGYDLSGDGTENGMVAVRFKTYKKDTIRGIQIYFNRSLNNVNEKYFKLAIWNEIDNKPGNIIYLKEDIKPVFEDSLNKFTSYIFEEPIVLENNFYIGWQKVYTTSLNVGFDLNRINNDKVFKNISGTWLPSVMEGTIMIRPMFGKKIKVITGSEDPIPQNLFDVEVYPNPAKDFITINVNNDFAESYNISIIDLHGRILINQKYDNSSFDISSLPNGLYFVRVVGSNNQTCSKKIIVIR